MIKIGDVAGWISQNGPFYIMQPDAAIDAKFSFYLEK